MSHHAQRGLTIHGGLGLVFTDVLGLQPNRRCLFLDNHQRCWSRKATVQSAAAKDMMSASTTDMRILLRFDGQAARDRIVKVRISS
jgi:hypothetical protein